MIIGATLHHVHLFSPQPEVLARFYGKAFGFDVQHVGREWLCSTAGRRVVFSEGAANQIAHIVFAFPDAAQLAAYAKRTGWGNAGTSTTVPASTLIGEGAIAFQDPDGHRVVFIAAPDAGGAAQPTAPGSGDRAGAASLPPAHSQHLALRTTQPEALLAFYQERLGFVLSDRVQDEAGTLRACFLRVDAMHHSLALFRSPETRFDHQSFETTGWQAMRDWADHMGDQYVPIVWGIGRHGPGNDTFFMVQDPDGNLGEISCDLEVCDAARPAGLWPHAQHTLNLWGNAIMRS